MPRKRSTPTATPTAALQESLQQQEWNNLMLRERLAELELALEEVGWLRAGDSQREFSREGLRKITAISRLMFLKNPLINRAVTIQAYYVWGQGMTVSTTDPAIQGALDAFMSDPRNQAEITSHQARTMKEMDLQVYGNLFLVLFTADMAAGGVVVRSINPDEIEEIICDPEDAKSPWFYKRSWTQQEFDTATGSTRTASRTAYYPDIRYEKAAGAPETIGSHPVMWDSPVYHVKVGGLSDMRFGVPETYQAQDWARAYNEFLANWATIVKAYARFAWKATTPGGPKGVAALKDRLHANDAGGADINRNPPPNTASTAVMSGGDLQPIRTAGATTAAADGMYLALMVSSAVGIPYPMLSGDPSTGNLATAKTLDRPTELKFRDRQELWRGIFTTILEYALMRSRRAAGGALRPYGDDFSSPITISFPPILEHDVTEQVKAVIAAATLDGKTLAGTIPLPHVARMALTALGAQNVEEIVSAIEDPPVDAAPAVAEALRGLREAIDGWRKAA
jgi:hypothetical protein